jgi:predicted Zn-dependent protease with MMP-like domain
MHRVSQQEFESIVGEAIDALPDKYLDRIHNVVFVSEDNPSPAQRQKLHLHDGQTLYGLYEGIPLTPRGSNYNLVLPDKITIFKHPLEWSASSLDNLKEQVRHTVWHEVAHYFGLDHDQIYQLDGTRA